MLAASRRQFLRGALFVAAAPIIVKAANIMPVRAPALYRPIVGAYHDPLTQMVTVFGTDEYGRAKTTTFAWSDYVDKNGHNLIVPGQWRHVDRITVA